MGKKIPVLFIITIVTVLSFIWGYYFGSAKTQKEVAKTRQENKAIEAKLDSRISILETEFYEYKTLFEKKQKGTEKEIANLRSQGLLLEGKSEILKAIPLVMEENFDMARFSLERAINSFEYAAKISLQQDIIVNDAIEGLIYDAKAAKEALSQESESARVKDHLEILSKKLDAVRSSMEGSAAPIVVY
jgi:hypothetical protein